MSESQTAHDRIDFLHGLRAVQHFRPEPAPPAVIDDILEVARWSGSASNRQPWELVVIRDRLLQQGSGRGLRQAPGRRAAGAGDL